MAADAGQHRVPHGTALPHLLGHVDSGGLAVSGGLPRPGTPGNDERRRPGAIVALAGERPSPAGPGGAEPHALRPDIADAGAQYATAADGVQQFSRPE